MLLPKQSSWIVKNLIKSLNLLDMQLHVICFVWMGWCWMLKEGPHWVVLAHTRMGSRVRLSSLFCPCCLFSCLLRGRERREHLANRINKCSVHQITVFKAHPELPVKHCWWCACESSCMQCGYLQMLFGVLSPPPWRDRSADTRVWV